MLGQVGTADLQGPRLSRPRASPLILLEAEGVELQGAGVLRDGSHNVIGGAGWNLGLDLHRHLDVCVAECSEVLDNCFRDLRRIPACPDRIETDCAMEAAGSSHRLGDPTAGESRPGEPTALSSFTPQPPATP